MLSRVSEFCQCNDRSLPLAGARVLSEILTDNLVQELYSQSGYHQAGLVHTQFVYILQCLLRSTLDLHKSRHDLEHSKSGWDQRSGYLYTLEIWRLCTENNHSRHHYQQSQQRIYNRSCHARCNTWDQRHSFHRCQGRNRGSCGSGGNNDGHNRDFVLDSPAQEEEPEVRGGR